MRKIISLIIGFIVMFIQIIPALAESPAEIECMEQKPDFNGLMDEWNELEEKTTESYQVHFEKVQEVYHGYMECLFEYARAKVLQESPRRQGTFQAQTPNVAFWMTPASACLTPEKVRETIDATQPDNLLIPALEAFDGYRNHLNKMKDIYDEITGDSNESEGIKFLNKAELESVLVVMDLAFSSFKELRTAFVMHVHFQCLLNNLDKYRRALSEIRRIADSLPGRLQNASMSK